jgi:nucleotide-binding universal stress UspA family protein
MYKKILVPLDISELSMVALPYAEQMAGRLGSEIILLSVSESAEAQDYHKHQMHVETIINATKHNAERYLEKPGVKAIKVESVVLVGHPAEEIIDYADKEDIDLIVMATHGRSGIGRWALGSTVDKVMRATERPVALIRAKGVHPDVREKGILNKALVPLDGSKEGEAVIPYIEELASRLKAEVILLQVGSPKADTEDYLEKVGGRLKGKGITTRFEVRVGDAAGEIIRFADEIDADLVAMSTHGRSGIGRWALGSVAERVLNAGNTPLLLVRAPGASTD